MQFSCVFILKFALYMFPTPVGTPAGVPTDEAEQLVTVSVICTNSYIYSDM